MNIRQDYLQQIIEEFGEVLRKLFTQDEKARYEEFELQLRSLCWHGANIPFEFVVQFKEDDLFKALRVGESLRPYRYAMLGDLLSLDSHALEREGRAWDALHRRRRALLMYAAAVRVAERNELLVLRRKAEAAAVLIDEPGLSADAMRYFEENWTQRIGEIGAPLEPESFWLDREDSEEFLAT